MLTRNQFEAQRPCVCMMIENPVLRGILNPNNLAMGDEVVVVSWEVRDCSIRVAALKNLPGGMPPTQDYDPKELHLHSWWVAPEDLVLISCDADLRGISSSPQSLIRDL